MLGSMGFFDFLRSKREADSEGGWTRKLAKYRDLEEDAEKLRLSSALLAEIGPAFDNPKIKPLPDDDEVELRARVQGMPFRVNIEYDVAWVRPEFKIENRAGNLTLTRDHEKIARSKEQNDDWADEDELRVFVAKGIFMEGDEDDIDTASATLQVLPATATEALLAGMEALRISQVCVYGQTLKATLPDLPDLDDPIRDISDAVRLLHGFGVALGAARAHAGEPAASSPSLIGASARLLCAYCTTRFLPGITTNCPNCGAVHTG
jgi:hypothetical protein